MKKLCLFLLALVPGIPCAFADTTTGLVSRYQLTEPFGALAIDDVGGVHGEYRGFVEQSASGACFHNNPDNPRVLIFGAPLGYAPISAFSVTAWIKPESLAHGGISGTANEGNWQFWMDEAGHLRLKTTDPNTGQHHETSSTGALSVGEWVHVGVTCDGAAVKFFIDGGLDSSAVGAGNGANIDPPVFFYLGRTNIAGLPLLGCLRDVRFYNRTLANADVRELGPFTIDPSYAGLWTGDVTLNEVKEAKTGTWAPSPVLQERILLHVTSRGRIRICGEATIMQTRVTPPSLPQQVIITKPNLIPDFDGITRRGGRLIGQRFSCAGFPVALGGALLADGSGGWLTTTTTLAANDPLNPFRHKYHPDLATGRELTRTFWMHLNPGDSPSDNAFTTVVYESISGLHKATLEARGPVTFTRVSTSGKLNQP